MGSVLVLGATGMLGSMVVDYLAGKGFEVHGTVRGIEVRQKNSPAVRLHQLNAEKAMETLPGIFRDVCPEFIVNCIGIIKPHCKDDDRAGVIRAIKVNAMFPHELATVARDADARVIQIATDCVYSGTRGRYTEDLPHDPLDVYGKTKSLGEVISENVLHVRCSIIGPEQGRSTSLLEWFLSQPETQEIKGYTHHRWNGVTTLQFAELCATILQQGKEKLDALRTISSVYHYCPNTIVTKFELLNLFAKIFGRSVTIRPVDDIGPAIDRTLATKYELQLDGAEEKNMEQALRELASYMRGMKNQGV